MIITTPQIKKSQITNYLVKQNKNSPHQIPKPAIPYFGGGGGDEGGIWAIVLKITIQQKTKTKTFNANA